MEEDPYETSCSFQKESRNSVISFASLGLSFHSSCYAGVYLKSFSQRSKFLAKTFKKFDSTIYLLNDFQIIFLSF